MKEQELIQKLQNAITVYDRILLLENDEQELLDLLYICSKKRIRKKILLLLGSMTCNLADDIDWMWLDEEDCAALKRLYYTYEFSDKFKILSLDINFGTILNYVRTGLLSVEETVVSLLS
ncbi:MAG: hypothetical protein K2M91_06945 [Lachnospiraceae bacterium]|nr:hypothetical protein [Lachnospiraceae bacterium]